MLLVVPRTQCAPHRKTGISLFDHLTGEYVTYTTHRHRVYSATTDISLPALFVYDFLCTFEEEKEVIWKRRFSGPSFLYVALRLFTAGYILLQILINLVPGDINEYGHDICVYLSNAHAIRDRCKTRVILADVFTVTVCFAYAAFNTLRVWAIWGQRRLYVLVMLPLTLVLPCVNIYWFANLYVANVSSNPIPFGVCICGTTLSQHVVDMLVLLVYYLWRWLTLHFLFSVGVVTRTSVLLSDVFTLTLTWVKTYGIKKAASQFGIQANFATLIMRDGMVFLTLRFLLPHSYPHHTSGTLYFGVHLMINLIAIITEFAVGGSGGVVSCDQAAPISGFSNV
ncbi:hypothetical protein NLI96_g6714 [Meripilus lineatus]|uniref:DUF6533 domain-containing protein n=1 Tax=Meripilus lineatus TaxID=2056292 RepID=A0AAD5V5R0_9APHY|nr:hypothetical protein NLI96_g6714 [Physisporinus lineatus]